MDARNDWTSNAAGRGQRQGDVGGASLAAVVAGIKDRLAAIAVDAMRARYDLGAFVHRMRATDHDASPAEVLRRLAKIFEMHTTALRRCARVAEVMSPQEFETLLSHRGHDGMPASWSHVELLVEIADAEVRRQLGRAITAEPLSVRALSARIRMRRKAGLAA